MPAYGSGVLSLTYARCPDICEEGSAQPQSEARCHPYQDTPGYGDELDVFRNLKLVKDYIESQNKK